MSTGALVSIGDYLRTVYRPDVDYVDGHLEDRNLGERDHSRVQKRLILLLGPLEATLGIHVYPEQRVHVAPTRFRVPDICIVAGEEPDEQVFTQPPFLCIEILSPEDRMTRMHERIDDYLRMGVPYVWLVDPVRRRGLVVTPQGMSEARIGILDTENPAIRVPLRELF